jgi:PAS domain S-box-containing protein
MLRASQKAEEKLRKAEEELNHHKKMFRAINERSESGVVVLSADTHPVYFAPSVVNVLGYPDYEAMHKEFFPLAHPDDINKLKQAFFASMADPGIAVSAESVRMKHRDGSWRSIDMTFTDMQSNPAVRGIVVNFRDVSAFNTAKEELRYANRLYSFISHINQTIVHTRDERTLYQKACEIAVEQGGFQFAWIGMVNKPVRAIEMQMSCGATKRDLEYFTGYTYDADGPIDKVSNGLDYFVVSDIENRSNNRFIIYAHERGFKSSICLPLKKSGEVIGTFNLYSSDKHQFNPREIALLTEATGDISFALDVLEKDRQRTLAEQRLKQSENRLKLAQTIAQLGSWELELASGRTAWSDEALSIYGLSANERGLSYEKWLSFVHPNDYEYVLNKTREAAATCNDTAFFHRIVRKDGEVRHVYLHAHPQSDSNGNLVSIHGVVHDVTNTKVAEQALLQSQRNLRTIVDSIPQSIFAKDYDGKLVFVNKSFAALFGMTPKQLLNSNLKDILPEGNEFNDHLETDRELIDTNGTSIVPELNFIDHNGCHRIFYTTKVPYTLPGKAIKALLVIAMDITQQKHADNERTKMLSDIVQRNKDLEQFSYIVSHNLRAPVANIIGLVTELNDDTHDAEVKNMLQRDMSTSVKKLDDVIIDLNKILQLKTEIVEEREDVKLPDLISDIRSSLSQLISEEKVQFDLNFEIDSLHTLKSYLQSIFYNLISNSIKYRQPNVSPVISITTTAYEKGVRIIFRDNGIGIDLARRGDHVFGLYKRFHHHVEGKGIGLFMVKTQVETLGGKITIDSKINEGTTFKIEFEDSKI